jgi:hypothetical protein
VGLLHQNHQDDTPFDVDPEPVDEELEILLDFRHYHLPQLEKKGFIEYDRDQHTIAKGPQFEEIEPLITLIDVHADELPDDWL